MLTFSNIFRIEPRSMFAISLKQVVQYIRLSFHTLLFPVCMRIERSFQLL